MTRTASLDSTISTGRAVFLPPLPSDPGSAHTPNAPVLCTEFGGVNITSASGQDSHHERGWGYTTASDPKDLLARVAALCDAVVHAGHICGFVYTQTTDIEQETNGLYTYDRRAKLPAAKVRAIIERAAQTYLSHAMKCANPRSFLFRGGLADESSVRVLRIEEGRYLVGECAVELQGNEWRASKLDLDDCFVNTWGKVTWAKGGGFVASCQNISLVDGTVMEVEAGDGKSWQRNVVRLEERVQNVGGQLVFD
jgi:hypothetical protein